MDPNEIKKQISGTFDKFMRRGESDRDIRNWDKRLNNQVQLGWENYFSRRIHLDQARDLERWSASGEFLCVHQVSSKSANALIRLNRNNNDPVDLELGVIIKTIFKEIHITNTAQPGEWLDLTVGINFEYYKQLKISNAEAQPCILLTNVAPAVNTIAAANPCNRVLIRAHTGNAGTIWIDFGNAAVVNACYELAAGDAISVPCNNTNRVNGILTNGGDIATIVFEV